MAQGAQAQLHLPVVPKEGSRTWSWLVEKWEALTCLGKGLGGVGMGMGRTGSVLWGICGSARVQ